MTNPNIYERREYIRDLLSRGERLDYREIAKKFDSSKPAIVNDVSLIETGKPYYKKSIGMGIASVQNNRAWRLGLSGRVSRDEWVAICKRHGNKCAICHRRLPLTMDHIKPLSRGGTHAVDNIQPLCKSCNSHKSNKV